MPIPEYNIPNPKGPFGSRILILAAHPDDEIVACAAAIGRAQQQGSTIFVHYLTHGCVARKTLWRWQRKHYNAYVERRLSEAAKAARFLNLTPTGNVPKRAARHLWRELSKVDSELRQLVTSFQIDQLWVPAYEGGNADHDALNALASKYASRYRVFEFAEYNFYEKRARSHLFPFPNGTEETITLTPQEQENKRMALEIYQSEKRNLNYVKTEHECFRALTTYNYSLPPHPGKLWYTRFQWVPFRHPRIDFTKPEEVSIAIRKFLA